MPTFYVCNMSYQTTAEGLRRFFEKFGYENSIGDIYIPPSHYTGQSQGYAFVKFYSYFQAQEAIDLLSGQDLDGRRVRVRLAKEPHREHGPSTDRARSSFLLDKSRSCFWSPSPSRSGTRSRSRSLSRSRSYSKKRRGSSPSSSSILGRYWDLEESNSSSSSSSRKCKKSKKSKNDDEENPKHTNKSRGNEGSTKSEQKIHSESETSCHHNEKKSDKVDKD